MTKVYKSGMYSLTRTEGDVSVLARVDHDSLEPLAKLQCAIALAKKSEHENTVPMLYDLMVSLDVRRGVLWQVMLLDKIDYITLNYPCSNVRVIISFKQRDDIHTLTVKGECMDKERGYCQLSSDDTDNLVRTLRTLVALPHRQLIGISIAAMSGIHGSYFKITGTESMNGTELIKHVRSVDYFGDDMLTLNSPLSIKLD